MKRIEKFDVFESRVVNEGILRDFAKSIVPVWLSDTVKVWFDKTKKVFINAVDIMTTLLNAKSVKGVKVASTVEVEGIDATLPEANDSDYSSAPWGANEKSNFKEFIATMSGSSVNEARIGTDALSGFGEVDARGRYSKRVTDNGDVLEHPRDVNKEFLVKYVYDYIMDTITAGSTPNPIMIFGAPSVGKTQLAKACIAAWNASVKSNNEKRSCIWIDASHLTLDGLSIPMPGGTANKDLSYLPDDVRRLLAGKEGEVQYEVTTDVPKQWLPMYKKTNDPEVNKAARIIANSHDTDDGKTGDGGIIVIDELFRASRGVFSILMNIINERKYFDWELGPKWGIICLSNRPNDDKTVEDAFQDATAAFFTRFAGIYNYTPTVKEWAEWALSTPGTVDSSFKFNKKASNKSYKTNIDERIVNFVASHPDYYLKMDATNVQNGELQGAGPRTWEMLSTNLRRYADYNDYSDWTEIPQSDLHTIVCGIIGEQAGQALLSTVGVSSKKDLSVMNSEDISNYIYASPLLDAEAFKAKLGKTKEVDIARLLMNVVPDSVYNTLDDKARKRFIKLVAACGKSQIGHFERYQGLEDAVEEIWAKK